MHDLHGTFILNYLIKFADYFSIIEYININIINVTGRALVPGFRLASNT